MEKTAFCKAAQKERDGIVVSAVLPSKPPREKWRLNLEQKTNKSSRPSNPRCKAAKVAGEPGLLYSIRNRPPPIHIYQSPAAKLTEYFSNKFCKQVNENKKTACHAIVTAAMEHRSVQETKLSGNVIGRARSFNSALPMTFLSHAS